MFKTILLTGAQGQVGHALSQAFDGFNFANKHHTSSMCLPKVVKLSRAELDLSSIDAIRHTVQIIKPDLIINTAAYTAVDKAETEADMAFAINATAPQILAEEAAKLNAKLIHFSTDYVYDGKKTKQYVESDPTQPLSVYGKSKLAGEEAIRHVGPQHLIFRTAWVYGAIGHNFMKTIVRLSQTRDALKIVSDQFGTPTSSVSIANAMIKVLLNWQQQSGIYHLVNQGETTWHGFAQEIVTQYIAQQKLPHLILRPENILPITTAEYPLPAARPANAQLNTNRLNADFGVQLSVWQNALSSVLQSLPNT